MSPDGGFYFLSKDQMLEYGLDSAFKERIDMATFTHETLVSQLDWTRIQQSLRDFELVFLQHPKVTDDGDEPELLIEAFLYLITLVSLYSPIDIAAQFDTLFANTTLHFH